MPLIPVFNEVLEAADSLSIAEQEALIDILRHRLTEIRRGEIVESVREAQHEYQIGKAQRTDVSEIMDDIIFAFVQHEGEEAILLEAVGTHDEVY